MADCAAIKTQLDEALALYNRLIAGGGVRAIQDSDGSRIEYSVPNINRLYQRVAYLQAQYDACVNGGVAAVTRPLTFIFGP